VNPTDLADDLEVARARVRVIIRRLSLQYANEINRQRSAGDRKAFDHNLSGTARARGTEPSCAGGGPRSSCFHERMSDSFLRELPFR
jgi:hypothetical protein